MDGWVLEQGGDYGEKGIPYWFSYNEDEKHISASVEPGGLHFAGIMENTEWELWKATIKNVATNVLGYKVGEIENGEVEY